MDLTQVKCIKFILIRI